MDMKKLSKDLFVRVKPNFDDAELITGESLTFWQDAWRRLLQNKPAVVSLWMIAILFLLAVVGPFLSPKNADGTRLRYDRAPIIMDENGKEIEKARLNYLPPRIPYIEKLGIFDGHMSVEIVSGTLFLGDPTKLPTEVKDIVTDPTKREEARELLGIKYLPNEYQVLSWKGEGKDTVLTIKVNGNEEKVAITDLMSEYSIYSPEHFKIKDSKIDRYGVQTLEIDLDAYAHDDIKDLYFWFGTDELAFDLWTRLWIGVRVSLLIGFTAMFVEFTIGIIYGSIAGYYAGTRIDDLMMRFVEILGSIPFLVLVILFMTIREPYLNMIEKITRLKLSTEAGALIVIISAMAVTDWIGVARLVRAQYLKLRDQEFVMAARTLGANGVRIMVKHLFPNIIGQLVVIGTFSIPGAIFAEAFLSLVGMGLPIPMSSLGTLINKGREVLNVYPYLMIVPSVVMVFLMLSINLLANGLRDALDPRLRGK